MLGDPVKRLEYTSRELAKRVSPHDRFYALVDITKLFAELLGHSELYRAANGLEADVIEWQYNAPIAEMARAEVWDEFTARLIQRVRDANLGNTPVDKLIPWLAREYTRLGGVESRAILREGLVGWHADTRADVMKMPAGDVVAAVENWLASRAEETVYEFSNGWTVKSLIGPAALVREGELLHHCVKNWKYLEAVAAGSKVIYSLRDPQNKPHVTMEWDLSNKRFEQMKMRDNVHPPSEEYRPMLVEFVTQVHGGNLHDLLLAGVPARDLDLRGANLSGAKLRRAELPDADLTGADLTRADLARANLTRAVLTRADLTRADLTSAWLDSAKLNGAVLIGADLTDAVLTDADLSGAIFDEKTIMPDGEYWSPPAGLGYYRRRRR